MHWYLLRVLVACALVIAGTAVRAAPPRVVASVAPVQSLVAGVMTGIGTPYLLVPGGQSPHSFALAPSDTRALANADVIVAASPVSEHFLERPLASLARAAEQVWMAQLPDAIRLVARSGGAAQPHDHGNQDGDEAHVPAGSAHLDPHLWLDPRNAVALTRAMGELLARLDPQHAGTYRANAADQVHRLRALDERLGARLAPLADRPYLVFHDAYQYFERRYRLSYAGAVTVDPGRSPGARRLAELRERVRDEGIQCLFVEPQFEPRLARVIAEGTGIRVATLDPLGAGIEPGPGLYFELMRGMAEGFRGCLLDDG